MAKYISLVTNDGTELINADQILYSETDTSSAAKIHLGDGAHHIAVTGTNLTSGFAEAINDALESAASTASSSSTTIPVLLPGGMTVTALAVTQFV